MAEFARNYAMAPAKSEAPPACRTGARNRGPAGVTPSRGHKRLRGAVFRSPGGAARGMLGGVSDVTRILSAIERGDRVWPAIMTAAVLSVVNLTPLALAAAVLVRFLLPRVRHVAVRAPFWGGAAVLVQPQA